MELKCSYCQDAFGHGLPTILLNYGPAFKSELLFTEPVLEEVVEPINRS